MTSPLTEARRLAGLEGGTNDWTLDEAQTLLPGMNLKPKRGEVAGKAPKNANISALKQALAKAAEDLELANRRAALGGRKRTAAEADMFTAAYRALGDAADYTLASDYLTKIEKEIRERLSAGDEEAMVAGITQAFRKNKLFVRVKHRGRQWEGQMRLAKGEELTAFTAEVHHTSQPPTFNFAITNASHSINKLVVSATSQKPEELPIKIVRLIQDIERKRAEHAKKSDYDKFFRR